MDDIVPLAVRQISHDESDIEPHEDVIWVDKYTAQDLKNMQLDDETSAQIIRWVEDDHKLSQAELALASPAIKYFWVLRRQLVMLSGVVYNQRVLRRQLVMLSGVVYNQRVEQQTGCDDNRGGWVLVAP